MIITIIVICGHRQKLTLCTFGDVCEYICEPAQWRWHAQLSNGKQGDWCAWCNILMGISPRVWVIWTPPREELPREAWFHLHTLWENPDVGIWTCPVTLNKWWVGALQNQNQTGTVLVCVDGCGLCSSFFSSPLIGWLLMWKNCS